MSAQKTDEKLVGKHIDTTIELIDQHVEKESITGVSNSIGSWIKTLGDHEEFDEISSDLEELKSAISEKDGKQIVSLMTKLGSETTKAAEKAQNGEVEKIKLLGKALSRAAKAISKFA